MGYECRVTEWTGQPTLSIRTRSSVQTLGKALAEAYGRIFQYLGEMGELPSGRPYTAYYNEDMDNLDVAIGVPVARGLPGRGDIEGGELPRGWVATCLHVGPYSGLGPAYAALAEWVDEHGYEATGVAYEVYLDDPSQTPSNELRTEVSFPLKAAERREERAG